jgi:O-antigen/teichoic acid export membrane protein
MIRLLGDSEYGLYNTVSSTISMLSVLSLGFNSGYIRFYSKYKKEDDQEAIHKLNGLFLSIFLIIGVIALLCGCFLSFHLDFVFDEGLTEKEYQIARILTLLLSVNMGISFPLSVFSNIISANERYIFLKLLGIIKTVVGPFVTLPLLLLGYRSIAMVSVTLAINCFTDCIYLYYVLQKLKSRFAFRGIEKNVFKELFTFTVFIAINMIVDQINSNIDKVLLGRFKGTTAVSIYSVGYLLYNYYMMFSTSISSVFTPRVHRIINETQADKQLQRRKLSELFIKVGRIQFLILGLVATGVIFFGKPFIYFWAGEGYEEAYYVALLLILPSTIALIQNLGIEIQRAENTHQFRSIVYLGMAILNLALSIWLCQLYGAVGSAVGTAISMIFANGIVMNIYYQKRCNIDVIAFWKSILKMFLGLLFPIAFGIVILYFVDLYSITALLFWMLGYVLVYCGSVWLLSMNDYERSLISKFVNKIFKHIKR